MQWLDNAWVVGTGTGVLSGIVVTWVAQWILSRKENRDYRKNVAEANREIVYTIRSGIPEEQIPSREIILALTNSTARRYSVSAADLYAPREIAEELIKEVMDSSFLPAGKKTEYGQLLLPIGAEQPAGVPYPEHVWQEREIYMAHRQETFLSSISATLGMLVA